MRWRWSITGGGTKHCTRRTSSWAPTRHRSIDSPRWSPSGLVFARRGDPAAAEVPRRGGRRRGGRRRGRAISPGLDYRSPRRAGSPVTTTPPANDSRPIRPGSTELESAWLAAASPGNIASACGPTTCRLSRPTRHRSPVRHATPRGCGTTCACPTTPRWRWATRTTRQICARPWRASIRSARQPRSKCAARCAISACARFRPACGRRTRSDPNGLTRREREVLELVRDNLTNEQIAERLVISVKTVDHHVSAVLAKLGVSSRRAASALVNT